MSQQITIPQPGLSECVIARSGPLEVSVEVLCDDCVYSFPAPRPYHLGRLLAELGFTLTDCAVAIDEWRERLNLKA